MFMQIDRHVALTDTFWLTDASCGVLTAVAVGQVSLTRLGQQVMPTRVCRRVESSTRSSRVKRKAVQLTNSKKYRAEHLTQLFTTSSRMKATKDSS